MEITGENLELFVSPSQDLWPALWRSAPIGLILYNARLEILSLNPVAASLLGELQASGLAWAPSTPGGVGLAQALLGVFDVSREAMLPHISLRGSDGRMHAYQLLARRLEAMPHLAFLAIYPMGPMSQKPQSDQALGQLAARIAHDLSNPLDGVLRYLALTRCQLESAISPEAAQCMGYLQHIHEGLVRISEQLKDLRAFGLDATGHQPPIELSKLLQQVLANLGPRATSAGITMELTGSLHPWPLVPASYYQVFGNLLRNSLDAMSHEAGSLQIEVLQMEGQSAVRIRDQGVGIGPEVLPRLGQLYVSTKAGGMGLGLAICREILERHGGELRLRNHPQGGCETLVLLGRL